MLTSAVKLNGIVPNWSGVMKCVNCYKTVADFLGDKHDEIGKLTIRINELQDLLTSANAIAKRNGQDTNWERFSKRIESYGIGSVTAKTFRILPSDLESPQDAR